jgi:hypothetical protein
VTASSFTGILLLLNDDGTDENHCDGKRVVRM